MNLRRRTLVCTQLIFSISLVILGSLKVTGAPCFQLVNSTTCTDLAGSWIMPSDKFTDVASFDAYIQSSLASSPAYIQQFNAVYGCPGFNGSLRYHASVICNYLVSYAAPQCTESKAATVTPLCQQTCSNFLMSLNQVFNDPAQCTPIDPAATDPNQKMQLILRTNEVQKGSFANYCQVLPSTLPPACTQGLDHDVANCGYMNSAFMGSYCATNNDLCCLGPAASMLVQEIADPNTLYLFVLAAVAGVVLFIVAFFVYCSYELKIRARNTTAVFHNSNKLGRKSVVATSRDELLYLDPKVSPGYNNPVGRKFTVARASYLPAASPAMNYGSLPRNISPKRVSSSRLSSGHIEEWRCIETFLPRLRDEMDAQRGDVVIVDEVFDDGWGAGTNTRTGQNGVFPLALFERVSDTLSRPKKPYQTRQPRQSSLPRRPLN